MAQYGKTPASMMKRASQRRRRGAATLWVIVSLPAFVVLLCVVIEIGNIWLARVELENAVEAAALAAVREFKETSDSAAARARGEVIGEANSVRGEAIDFDQNAGAGTNGNDDCDGDIVLGTIIIMAGMVDFDADTVPAGSGDIFGARVNKSVDIASVCGDFLGVSFGTYSITARTYASCEHPAGPPRLLRMDRYICDGDVRDPSD